jgi:hypothetical protein
VPLLVALEAESLLFVSFTLMRDKSSHDVVEINSAGVRRRPASASPTSTTSAATKPFTALKALGACDHWVLERVLLGMSTASGVVRRGWCVP